MKSHASFTTYPIFDSGFRIFFLLAVFSALGLLILWQSIKDGSLMPVAYFSGSYWHAHEMIFGYGVAVIAGFLLTAVNNWAGRVVLSREYLIGLSLLWFYGRAAPFYAEDLPYALIAVIDLAFLPVLTFLIIRSVWQLKIYRHLVLLVFLVVLTIGNIFVHAEMLSLCQGTARIGIQLVLMTIYLLILVMAGRIFPLFAERAMSGILISRNRILDYFAVASALIFFIVEIFQITGSVLAIFALIAAATNGLRLFNWFVLRVCFVPLLWILYLGYGWLVVGFILSALSAWSLLDTLVAMHAFALGGIGVLTLGMVARVSLTNTGRALKAQTPTVLAFVLINVTVLCQVVLPLLFSSWSEDLIYLAVMAWLAAFALFLFDYMVIFTQKNV